MTVRIRPKTNPDAKAVEQLDAIKKMMGNTPNIFTTLANSSAALNYYLAGAAALNNTKISSAVREQLSMTVAGINNCDYCASAHTAIGAACRIPTAELSNNLIGKSDDHKTQAALSFAAQIVNKRGRISDDELNAIRNAGYSDEEIIEIIAIVCQNIFTNYFNHIAGTEIDFPKVTTA